MKIIIATCVLLSASLAHAADQAALRRLLPRIDNAELTAKIQEATFFTDADFPKAYQITGETGDLLAGVHSVYNDISGGADFKQFGNGNREFPWGDAAGTQLSSNIYAFRLLYLPPRDSGGRWPIVYWNGRGVQWTYPVGAMLGECLCLYAPDGIAWPFELRLRIRAATHWEVDAYRPFESATHLAAVVKELPESSQRERLLQQLAVPDSRLPSYRVRADHPRQVSFDRSARIDSLTPLPKLDVEKLLNRTFVSVQGAKWREGAFAPSTKADFHIVPRDYVMAVVEVDSDSCMDCHKHTAKHVDAFDDDRDWYGNIRGSDGIFSIHPFDRSSISSNGSSLPVRINQRLVRDGIFAPYRRENHPPEMYTKIEGLR